MKRLMRWSAAAVAAFACGAASVHAHGPLNVCNNAPVKYPGAGTITLNYDLGNLGSRTKAQADSIVTSAVSLWTNVPTATVTLARGADLPEDVTTANYSNYLGQFTDGRNPVIYDTDGSLTDLLLGTGAHNSVLGFAGSAAYGPPTCQYAEGQAVINGALAVSDTTLGVVIAHEVGHLIGLDHTQLDSSQGLAGANYPLMYPVAYRTSLTLHEDDVAAITSLYPGTNVNASYGQLSGTLTDGTTPVRGANIWAQENTSGSAYAVVSDYLMQGTGYFNLLLPPGTYTLHVEAVHGTFNGGSSVGPYSDTYPTDPSFQPPLYSGSTPMAPVTLGNSIPTQIQVTAGCSGNVAFRLDGTGTVTGNCSAPAVTPASMTSPANGSTLPGSSVTFQWTAATGATLYQVYVGNSLGAYDIGYFPAAGTTSTSTTVTGLPTDGRILYVRLFSAINGTWYFQDYSYRAASPPAPQPATMASPLQGTMLPSSTVTFQWNAAAGATLYQVFVGNSVGAFDLGYYPTTGTTGTSTTVTGLPTDGRTIYVRLNTAINGVWYHLDYTYIAGSATPATPASIASPANGGTLTGSSVTFQWNAATGASLYQVFVGNSVGAFDIGYYPPAGTTGTSTTVTGLPTDGRKLYVRLYSNIRGTYYYTDSVYTASGAPSPPPTPTPAAITSPANASTLAGSSVTFQWNAATGATLYQVFVGNSVGAYDIGYFPASGTTSTSTTVAGMPTDGRTLYVRLYTAIGGVWYFRDFTYTAAGAPATPTPASFTNPANGSTLSGSSVTFQWNAATGATLYQVWVGNTVGAYDIGYYPASGTTATSTLVSGLPTDGRMLYVRLYSAINGTWYYRDFTYRSGP